MATNLPASGTLRYNGVDFSGMFHSSISGVAEYDEAGRTVKWMKWTLEVEGYITAGAFLSTDSEMENLRVALMTPAKELKYRTKGFGDLWVNGGSRAFDANWGPKPEMLSWSPVGDNQAALITWRVTTCIPECDNPRYTGIAAFNYDIDFDIDREGYTTRTISGYLEIAQTRSRGEGRRVQSNADAFRHLTRPLPLVGFERTTQKVKLSKDKNRIDFTYTDKQIPRALPDEVAVMECDETLHNDGPGNFVLWNVQFSGSVTLPPDKPKSLAFQKIMQVVLSRLSKAQRLRAGLDLKTALAPKAIPGKGALYRILNFRLTDQVFGRSTRFDLTFQVMGMKLQDILAGSGLWEPIEGTDFVRWRDSLLGNVFHERGAARLEVTDGEEVIVDLCLRKNPRPPEEGADPGLKDPEKNPQQRPGRDPEPKVPPEASWLLYENTLTVITVNRTARHKRLGDAGGGRDDFQPGFIAADPVGGTADLFVSLPPDRSPPTPEPTQRQPDKIQTTGSPAYVILMRGKAKRLGHAVPIPRLVSVGGVKVTQGYAVAPHGIVGDSAGVPVYGASWMIYYHLPEKMRGRIPDLANPLYGFDGGT